MNLNKVWSARCSVKPTNETEAKMRKSSKSEAFSNLVYVSWLQRAFMQRRHEFCSHSGMTQ
jgi:hypothetical protein